MQRKSAQMIFIGLGANLPSLSGPPAETLRACLRALEASGVAVLRVSSFYETRAWPDPSDPPFVNAVASIATDLAPPELLCRLQEIENAFGRERGRANAPRTLDLDILDYDGREEAGPPIVPHPRLAERGFVLIPLAEIEPDWRHPVDGRSVRALLAALPEGEEDGVKRQV
jgi:2-amino-4-hydroxy-6-hydroxymethyldihydropteridine diphosphokinase